MKHLTAVIIKGNPNRITLQTYGGLYEELSSELEKKGIEIIAIDEGAPYTTPPKADIWIGHSRGIDRLQFAPEGTLTIKLGSVEPDSINHPQEITSSNPDDYDALTDEQKRFHLTLHPEMTQKIIKKINDHFSTSL